MPLPNIEIRHLNKVFFHNILDSFKSSGSTTVDSEPQDKIVLADFNLEIKSGETIGIIGKNGAGKSTLLSIIAGVAKQTSGEIIVSGKVTAVMTLGVGLREDLSGRENIYIDGEIQGKSRSEIDDFIDEIIDFSELGDFIDKPVKLYSTGMKSRLAFSMLVCIEPEILIIDEALSAGDVFFAAKATKKIHEICKRGKIVIIVSHGMGTITTMCNRCLWLDKGKMLMDGDPNTVTQAYLDLIKDEDSSVEQSHYQTDILEYSPSANDRIKSVHLRSIGSGDQKNTVFYTGNPFVVEVHITRGVIFDASLDISIERLDGLIVDCQQIDLSKARHSNYILELSLTSLVLNQGYYLLKIDLIESQSTTNHFVRLFEVKNNKMASGGYSILHYPAEISLMNEEDYICSDSIELMVE